MADILRSTPLPSFCFKVTISVAGENNADAFFRSVGGLKIETEVLDVRAGGVNDTTFRLPGATKWSNITLKRGYTASNGFLQWRLQWLTGERKLRTSGTIIQLNTKLEPVMTWEFEEAWPVKWEVSDFDATKSELSIETLELAHHGIKIPSAGK
jgi:phage tail-like protein